MIARLERDIVELFKVKDKQAETNSSLISYNVNVKLNYLA
jgi:hypothetical protein